MLVSTTSMAAVLQEGGNAALQRFIALATQVHHCLRLEAATLLAEQQPMPTQWADAWLDAHGCLRLDAQAPARALPRGDLSERQWERLIARLAGNLAPDHLLVCRSEQTTHRLPGITPAGLTFLEQHSMEVTPGLFEAAPVRLLVIDTVGPAGQFRASCHYPIVGQEIMAAALVVGRNRASRQQVEANARGACLAALAQRDAVAGYQASGTRLPPPAQRH